VEVVEFAAEVSLELREIFGHRGSHDAQIGRNVAMSETIPHGPHELPVVTEESGFQATISCSQ